MLFPAEQGPGSHVLDYFREFFKHHDDSSRYRIHLVAFAHDFSVLELKPHVFVYDYLSNEYKNFGKCMQKQCQIHK